MAGPYGPQRPLAVLTSLLGSFATSSHVLGFYGPQLSFRTAGFVARRFKWGISNFCQVPIKRGTSGFTDPVGTSMA